jgi:hypothetical protein
MEILEFMKSLLTFSTDSRITTEEALVSTWISGFKRRQCYSDFKLPTKLDDNNIIHTRTEWSPQAKWIQGARIGSGGYGTVWLQRSPCGSHERAVKVFQNKYDGSNLREIEILTMVSSVSILPLDLKLYNYG